MTGADPVLVVNVGSHSLKASLVDAAETVHDEFASEEAPDSPATAQAFDAFLGRVRGEAAAVGHRIVHGGHELNRHRVIDDAVRATLDEAVSLDPLHLVPALRYVDRCREVLDAVQVACLDTAFHTTMPQVASTYPLPAQWRQRHRIKRYGFHGLSHAWAAQRAAELLGRPAEESSLVSVHLGGGSSACAIQAGHSVWCSMGFSPLEGLMMATRSGSIDPGIVLWLQQHAGLSVEEISHALQHESGLLGLSDGLSEDTRVLVPAARAGNAAAELALDVFSLRVRQEIGAAAVSLGKLDALVFTGEIGADQPEVRQAVTARLRTLNVAPVLDPAQADDAVISADGDHVPVLLVHPREDLQIAREVRGVLAATP